jgi:hypothetical protein
MITIILLEGKSEVKMEKVKSPLISRDIKVALSVGTLAAGIYALFHCLEVSNTFGGIVSAFVVGSSLVFFTFNTFSES